MKKLLFSLVCAFVFINVYSQTNQPNKKYYDLIEDFKNSLQKSILPDKPTIKESGIGSFSVKMLPLNGVKIGNNQKGFDIYSMLPYNTPCLVPDSTFHSNMPVVGLQNGMAFNRTPQSNIIQK